MISRLSFAIAVVTVTVAASLSPPPTPSGVSTILVMRHCIRTVQAVHHGAAGFTSLDDYSHSPWPTQLIDPSMRCLPRGLQLIEGQGRAWQRGTLDGLTAPIRISSAHSGLRFNQTAAAFASGLLGCPDCWSYNPTVCSASCNVSISAQDAVVQQQLASVPKPVGYASDIATLQQLLGNGAAPEIDAIKTTVYGGQVGGGLAVASQAAEALLSEYGAGLEMGWGRLNTTEMERFMRVHDYKMRVAFRTLISAKARNGNLATTILTRIQSGSSGSQVYIVGDTNMVGLSAILRTTWHGLPSLSDIPTPPGAALRFRFFRTNGQSVVRADYVYTTFGSAAGNLSSGPVVFESTGTDMIGLADFETLLHEAQNCPHQS